MRIVLRQSLFAATVLAFLTLCLCSQQARAGYWNVTYEASGEDDFDGYSIPWPSNPTPNYTGMVRFGSDGSASSKSAGEISATLTWVPSSATDSPPSKIVIKETADAMAHSFGTPAMYMIEANNGLGSEVQFDPPPWPGADQFKSCDGIKTQVMGVPPANSQGTVSIKLPERALIAAMVQDYGGTDTRVGYVVQVYAGHEHPTNFREDLSKRRGYPDARLYFVYLWDSTSGNKDPDGIGNVDLGHIYVGERVTYPGSSDPWDAPDPPYALGYWRYNNPTITPDPNVNNGNIGRLQDEHLAGTRFRHPHQAGTYSFTATQYYRFHCSLCMGSGEYENLMGPLYIRRTVKNLTADYENGDWVIIQDKDGLSAGNDVVFTDPDDDPDE